MRGKWKVFKKCTLERRVHEEFESCNSYVFVVGHEIYFVHESAQREYSTNTHEDGIAIFRNSMENEGIFLNGYNQ